MQLRRRLALTLLLTLLLRLKGTRTRQRTCESFQNLYLGPRNYVPTNDTDRPLVIGMLYYNTVDGQMYVWNGGEWKTGKQRGH